MTYYDFSGAFQNLNSAIGGLRKQFDDDRKRQSLADLGKDIGAGNYDAAAQRAFALGDADTGIKIATLGKTAQQEADWMKNNGGLLGLGNPQPVAPAQPSASSTATSQGETSFGDRSLPRGIRNNNPGNIEAGNFTAGLPGFKGSDGRFAQFETPEQGIVAADRLLQSYAGRGLNTVAGIVNRWAPPSENNTGAYVASVAKELGVDPSQPLDMTNPQVRQRLIAAKIRVENGRQPYGDDVFARAYGGGGAPQVAAPIVPVQTAALGAPGQPVAPISGDDPVKLRQDAERYAQSNPEAARQLLARAEAAERGSGTQMAQAAPQAGTPMADLPAQGAAQAQGFAIPGGQQVESSIANDPRVMNLQRALAGAPDRFKPSIQSRLNILVEELKAQRQQNAPTDAVRNYRFYREEEQAAGRQPMSFQQFRESTKAQTNVNVGGGSDKQIFDNMEKGAEAASSAAVGLQSIREARRAVEGGGYFGAGADLRLGFQKAAQGLGIGNPEALSKIVNTETFRSAIAPQIAATMKATVGSTQISNADRDFAEKAAGGSITLDQKSITRLLGIMEKANKAIIERHQKRLDTIYPEEGGKFGRERALFGVQAPVEEEPAAVPTPPSPPAPPAPPQRPQVPAGQPTATGPNGQRMIWNGQAWVPLT